MKPLTILSDERKLELNNSGTVLLARMIPLKEIKLQKEFQDLFPLNPSRVESITQSIIDDKYDNSQPLHIWHVEGKYVLIDGHHRREASLQAGLYDVPCYLHEFDYIEQALKYAISLQTERRNLSDAELLKALKVVDSLKMRGRGSDGGGKSATRTAEVLGISTSRVEKSRFIELNASQEIKKQIESGEISLNMAYQLTKDSLTQEGKKINKKEKKKNSGRIELLTTINSFLFCDDFEGLQSYVQKELEKESVKDE